jgi:hypothetical protein
MRHSDKFVYYDESTIDYEEFDNEYAQDEPKVLCFNCSRKYKCLKYHTIYKKTWREVNNIYIDLYRRKGRNVNFSYELFERGLDLWGVYKIKGGKESYYTYIDTNTTNEISVYRKNKILKNHPCYNTSLNYILLCTSIMMYPEDRFYHEENMEMVKHEIREHYMNRLRGKLAMMLMKKVI